MNLSDLSWGDDSAEKDNCLLEYFVTSDAFRRLASRQKNFVVGRKGSGKSALLAKLRQCFLERSLVVVTVKPRYNSIRAVLNDKDVVEGFGQEIFFQHTWLRHILIDLLCEIGRNARGGLVSGSMEFARLIAREQNETALDFAENITDVFTRLRVKAGNLEVA